MDTRRDIFNNYLNMVIANQINNFIQEASDTPRYMELMSERDNFLNTLDSEVKDIFIFYEELQSEMEQIIISHIQKEMLNDFIFVARSLRWIE